MPAPKPSIFWILTLFALILWVLVAYVAWSLYAQMQAQAFESGRSVKIAQQRAQAIERTSLARAIKQDIALLDALGAKDVVSIVKIISDVGRDAHVDFSIKDAVLVVRSDARTKTAILPKLNAYDISIEATGSFDNIMRMIYMLENIPALSSITTFDLQRQDDTKAQSSWHIDASIRIFTSTSI